MAVVSLGEANGPLLGRNLYFVLAWGLCILQSVFEEIRKRWNLNDESAPLRWCSGSTPIREAKTDSVDR